jgi:hypothetical protein
MCDLGLQIRGSMLEKRIARLQTEIDERGLRFRPHYWLSDEWFSPDGVPGVAIPFFLAHPRLARLELHNMLEVEGGEEEWCMRILRHECGHAIDNAYRLRLNRRRRRIFGSPALRYPDYYSAKPYSKSFVLHLDSWYAQSHPDEDFAETFAVWLTPGYDWRERYAGWPALRKLEFMDELMSGLKGRIAPVRTKRKVDPLSTLTKTLGEHYSERKSKYGREHPSFYDKDLRRIFSDEAEYSRNKLASVFLRSIRREVRTSVANWTGTYQYTIDQLMKDIIGRCTDLKLRLKFDEAVTRNEFVILLTVQTMNYLHSGRHMIAL